MPDVTVGATAAYLAVPHGSAGPWPGVVVIHEAFGLNADTRATPTGWPRSATWRWPRT